MLTKERAISINHSTERFLTLAALLFNVHGAKLYHLIYQAKTHNLK